MQHRESFPLEHLFCFFIFFVLLVFAASAMSLNMYNTFDFMNDMAEMVQEGLSVCLYKSYKLYYAEGRKTA